MSRAEDNYREVLQRTQASDRVSGAETVRREVVRLTALERAVVKAAIAWAKARHYQPSPCVREEAAVLAACAALDAAEREG